MPKRIQRTKRYAWLGVCGLAVLLFAAHEIFGENGYLARQQRRLQIQSLTSEIQKLKQENVELVQKIKNLRSDPNTIEKLAREQLRLGRPGDVVVTLSPAEQLAVSPATPLPPQNKKK